MPFWNLLRTFLILFIIQTSFSWAINFLTSIWLNPCSVLWLTPCAVINSCIHGKICPPPNFLVSLEALYFISIRLTIHFRGFLWKFVAFTSQVINVKVENFKLFPNDKHLSISEHHFIFDCPYLFNFKRQFFLDVTNSYHCRTVKANDCSTFPLRQFTSHNFTSDALSEIEASFILGMVLISPKLSCLQTVLFQYCEMESALLFHTSCQNWNITEVK